MSYAVLSGFPFFPVFRSRTFSRFYRFPGAPRLEIVGGRFLLVSRNRVRVSRPNILADLKTAVIINNRHERKHLRTIIQVIQYSIVLPLIIIVSIIVVNWFSSRRWFFFFQLAKRDLIGYFFIFFFHLAVIIFVPTTAESEKKIRRQRRI